jgi:hypothetical protein
MDFLVLLAILALLILGPRRGRRMPGPVAILIGIIILLWLAAAFGLGSLWNGIFGPAARR